MKSIKSIFKSIVRSTKATFKPRPKLNPTSAVPFSPRPFPSPSPSYTSAPRPAPARLLPRPSRIPRDRAFERETYPPSYSDAITLSAMWRDIEGTMEGTPIRASPFPTFIRRVPPPSVDSPAPVVASTSEEPVVMVRSSSQEIPDITFSASTSPTEKRCSCEPRQSRTSGELQVRVIDRLDKKLQKIARGPAPALPPRTASLPPFFYEMTKLERELAERVVEGERRRTWASMESAPVCAAGN
ncbi:hypothetical protein P7C70_g2200, partial [Phenoliferia sp. Uapishka_3]